MKKLSKLVVFLVFITMIFIQSLAHAFNPIAHLYIAEKVFQNKNINLQYGSISPDLSLYVDNPEKWPTAFTDTHYEYIDLRPYALSPTQRAFALGWLTHNEAWGADYYAHVEYPPGSGIGYVIEKADILSKEIGLDPEFAHFAIETAIDVLLINNVDPELGERLLKANLLRSWEDRNLLVRVLVWNEKRTDWLTLATAELTFRNLITRYAMVICLPSPQREQSLADLGAKLALEMYGITVSPEEALHILEYAIQLCEEDYKEVIDFTIEQIKNRI